MVNFKTGDVVLVLPIARVLIGYAGPIMSPVTILKIQESQVDFYETGYVALLSYLIKCPSLIQELI